MQPRDFLMNTAVRCGVIALLSLTSSAFSQHQHDHSSAAPKPLKPPRVFLDKSPRVVAYQLKRLSNERLLLVERNTKDPKYAPVYSAILTRAGMSPQFREEALEGLVAVKKSNPVSELVAALESMKSTDRQQARTATELASLLLARDLESLMPHVSAFEEATRSSNVFIRRLGYAGLISTDQSARVLAKAKEEKHTLDWLEALQAVPSQEMRNQLSEAILSTLADTMDLAEKKAAVRALRYVSNDPGRIFKRLVSLLEDERLRTPCVRTLLKIPAEHRDSAASAQCVDMLVRLAEQTAAELRTTDEFLDAMQLADQLFARLPVSDGRSYRKRLSEVTVRVIKIHTIEEEMRYDIPYFAVEAGRPVQVVLVNEDLMPHNLVVTTEGSLKEVANLGLAVGPNGGHEGKQYVPDSDKVLFATNMVPAAKSERLTFTAPSEPGEYPYVCTFPRHWMRMYGVMKVVEDLDAYLQNPVPSKDPLGSTRSFVKNWTIDDFRDDLTTINQRSLANGTKLFTEATCAQCHKAGGAGGAVGPALDGVFGRWKDDAMAVLQEIVDPSHRIDPKYAVHLIITEDGETISGIVAAEDKQKVSILANPESKELTVVQRTSIAEMVKTSTSMMPKGLLDRFQKDEVLDLLGYLASLKDSAP